MPQLWAVPHWNELSPQKCLRHMKLFWILTLASTLGIEREDSFCLLFSLFNICGEDAFLLKRRNISILFPPPDTFAHKCTSAMYSGCVFMGLLSLYSHVAVVGPKWERSKIGTYRDGLLQWSDEGRDRKLKELVLFSLANVWRKDVSK